MTDRQSNQTDSALTCYAAHGTALTERNRAQYGRRASYRETGSRKAGLRAPQTKKLNFSDLHGIWSGAGQRGEPDAVVVVWDIVEELEDKLMPP